MLERAERSRFASKRKPLPLNLDLRTTQRHGSSARSKDPNCRPPLQESIIPCKGVEDHAAPVSLGSTLLKRFAKELRDG
jgi:hypothetical protein